MMMIMMIMMLEDVWSEISLPDLHLFVYRNTLGYP